MIEQYFRPGVRYLWNKPNDAIGPLNGALVPSVMVSNNLTYDGLDGHQAVIDPPLLVNVNATLGLAMRATVPHSWLDYAPGRTSYLQIGGNDILTGYMSGCLIARGTHLGVMSAFHVGTIVGNAGVNQTVKQNFFANLPADATGFNPAGAWTHGEVAAIQASLGGGVVATPNILALVTAGGVFYSILMFNVAEGGQWVNLAGQRRWCVGGKKLVQPLNRIRVRGSLL